MSERLLILITVSSLSAGVCNSPGALEAAPLPGDAAGGGNGGSLPSGLPLSPPPPPPLEESQGQSTSRCCLLPQTRHAGLEEPSEDDELSELASETGLGEVGTNSGAAWVVGGGGVALAGAAGCCNAARACVKVCTVVSSSPT